MRKINARARGVAPVAFAGLLVMVIVAGAAGSRCTGGSGNARENGTHGNYWGDYTTVYPNAINDGTTWDTPYVIAGDGYQDNHPLVTSPVGGEPDPGDDGDPTNGEDPEGELPIPGYDTWLVAIAFVAVLALVAGAVSRRRT